MARITEIKVMFNVNSLGLQRCLTQRDQGMGRQKMQATG